MSENERSLKPEMARGPIVILKPKELAENGTTGTIAEGIYEGTEKKPAGVSKAGKKYGASTEYKIRGENDTLFILKETAAIKEQLGQLAEDGSDKVRVRIQYNGKVQTKSNKDYHDFEVFVVEPPPAA